jgi:hypothetical protein
MGEEAARPDLVEVGVPGASMDRAEPSPRLTQLDLVTLVLAWVAAPAALLATVAASLWDWSSGDFLVALVFGSAVLWVLGGFVLVSTPAMAHRVPATWYPPPPVPQHTYYFPEASGVPEPRSVDETREPT